MFDYVTIAVSLADPLTSVHPGRTSHSVTYLQLALGQAYLIYKFSEDKFTKKKLQHNDTSILSIILIIGQNATPMLDETDLYENWF
jgi:hypothetical protein